MRGATIPVNLSGQSHSGGLAVSLRRPYLFLMAYGLTIVVPTFNEAGNVESLVDRLEAALTDTAWEVVFVDDDSTDGTAEVVRRLSRHRDNVRLIVRVGRRGLATAAVEGMLSSTAPVLAVMDGDLQHDPAVLPGMLSTLERNNLDIVVASRFAGGSRVEGLSESRKLLSRVGNSIARRVARAELSDPLTGFFMLRQSLLDEVVHDLTGTGFKILLDIFASAKRGLRFEEVPMTFHERHSGESKLDVTVMLAFAAMIFDKLVGRIVPVGLLAVLLAIAAGIALHMLFLAALMTWTAASFGAAQAVAAIAVMITGCVAALRFESSFRRARRRDVVGAFLVFGVAAAFGLAANLWLAWLVTQAGAGWMIAGLCGGAIGVLWTYVVGQAVLRSRGAARA